MKLCARPRTDLAGVVGLVRGKGCSPDKPLPYERDSADAAARDRLDRRAAVSEAASACTAAATKAAPTWAAAKRMPKALKAIMTGAPVAPGIDVPMEGNVFWSFVYPWPFYTTNNKTLDDATYGDSARWQRLDHDWYASGPRLPRSGEDRRRAKSGLRSRGSPIPATTRTRARMIPVQGGVRANQHSGAHHRGLLLRRPGRGGLLLHRAHQVPPERGALPADRSLRPRARPTAARSASSARRP